MLSYPVFHAELHACASIRASYPAPYFDAPAMLRSQASSSALTALASSSSSPCPLSSASSFLMAVFLVGVFLTFLEGDPSSPSSTSSLMRLVGEGFLEVASLPADLEFGRVIPLALNTRSKRFALDSISTISGRSELADMLTLHPLMEVQAHPKLSGSQTSCH